MRVPQVSERIKEAPAQALRGVFAGIGQLLLITDKLRNKASHQDVPRARTPGTSASVTDTAVTSPAGQGAGTAAAPAGTVAEAAPAGAARAGAAPAGAAPVAAAAPPAAAAPAAPGPAEPSAAKPPTARRAAAKPAAGKPVTPKPAAKPVTAKPPTARRPAAKAAAESAAAAGEAPPKPPKRQSTRDFDRTGNVRLLGDETAGPAAAAAPQPAAGPEPAAAAADTAPLPNYDELSVPSLRARLRNLDVTRVRQLAEYERAHAARAEVLTMFERRIAKLEAEA
jgi:hypothetical protein